MKPEESERFAQAFNRVFIMYRQTDAPTAVIQVYFDYLKRYQLEEVLLAIRGALKANPDYFPTAPQIEAFMLKQISLPNRSHEAVSEIIAIVEQGKCRRTGPLSTQLTVDASSLSPDAARDEALRRCPPPDSNQERPFWANRFRQAYEQALNDINSGCDYSHPRIEDSTMKTMIENLRKEI
jgi:hypothetical protein